MAKYYQKHAQGRGRVGNPDLYAELRAFGRQNQDIVNAAKEHDLRIQERNDAWDKSQKGVESNALENRKELQDFENQKFNTRKDAIQKRRDTEVDRLKGEAKIAERRASDWQALTPKLAKAVTDVATTGYKLADYHFGHKEYKKKGGLNDIIYSTSAFVNDKGIADLEAATLKLEAYRKGDYEALKWTGDRLDYSVPKAQALFTRDFKANFDQGVAFRKAEIVKSGIRYDDTTIEDIWGLMGQEVLDKSGIDINSKEGQEIVRLFRDHSYKEKLEYVNVRDEGERKLQHENNLNWLEENHQGASGTEIFHNSILDQMKQNFRYNGRTGEYELKATGEHFTLKDAWSKVLTDLTKKDWIQEKGWEYFKKNFYERELPRENKTSPIEYGYIKFPEEEELLLKSFNAQAELKRSNKAGLLQKSEEDFISELDRITNPNATLREGEVYLDPLDTSKGGGFDMIVSKARFAPTEKARNHAYSKIDYTVSKSNKYNLTLHKAMLKAHVSGDAAGWIKIYNQIKDPAIKQAWENKYQLATVYLEAGESFESIEDFSKNQVVKKVGGDPSLGTNQLKGNYQDQIAELNQYTNWYVENNIGRLKEEFGGDATAFFKKMKDEVAEEFGQKDSKRFPVIQVGGALSLPGQKQLLFANHIRGGSDGQEVQTIKDYTKKMNSYLNPVDSSHPSLMAYEKTKIPNIGDLIANDDVLTDSEARNIARSIEEGGGVGNYIPIKGDIKELADMHPEWTARDIVNKVLEKKGYKHKLPPDNETLLRWSGYEGKKPRPIDIDNVIFYRNIMNEAEGDFFKRDDLIGRNKTYIPGVGSTGLIL